MLTLSLLLGMGLKVCNLSLEFWRKHFFFFKLSILVVIEAQVYVGKLNSRFLRIELVNLATQKNIRLEKGHITLLANESTKRL